MEKALIGLLVLILFASCSGKIKYAAFIPSQNRFVKYFNKECVFGDYDLQTGDTVIINNEKAIIISPFRH